jgi:hypothetical protein
MNNMEIRLDTLLDLMSDEEWAVIKLKMESKKAFRKVELVREKRQSATQFGDWLLLHSITPDVNENITICWSKRIDGVLTYHTTLELYAIYISGEWDKNEDEDEDEDN